MSGKLENMVSNLKTYLFAIGKNKILEHHRRNARHDYDTKAEILQMEEEDQESLKNLKVISRVWLFPDPQMKQVNVWFIDDSAARIIQATTNIPIFQFEQKFSQDPIPSTQKLEPIAINGKAPWDPAFARG